VTADESENAQLVRRGYAAFNSEDFDEAIELMQPDIEWTRADTAPDPEPLHGVAAIREWMQPDIFEHQHAEIVEILDNGERLFVELLFRVRARGSGIEVTNRGFHVWTVREGKASRLQFFQERAPALEAAGLAG
jgi:ketosteroid isomerase-like protein